MPKKDSVSDARQWAKNKSGNVKALFVIAPEHERALRDEAFSRAKDAGSARPDASAVLREILDGWLKRRAK